MIRKDDVIPIGRLLKTHGIKGELTLLFDDAAYAEIDSEYYLLEIDGLLVPFFVEEFRTATHVSAYVKFDDINNETEAAKLSRLTVYLNRNTVLNHAEDEQLPLGWSFFVGYTIYDRQNNRIGIIENVDDATINVLFIVKDGKKEHLIPATDDFVIAIDDDKKTIQMDLPEGLIE